MKISTRKALKTTICSHAIALSSSLLAAELSTDFPKPPFPLELPPRMGRPLGDNAVFQQQMPVPVWVWTLPNAAVHVTFDDQKHVTTSGPDSYFKVRLKAVNDALAGNVLTVETRVGGKQERKVCYNILIGEKKEHSKNKYDVALPLANNDGLPASRFSTGGY